MSANAVLQPVARPHGALGLAPMEGVIDGLTRALLCEQGGLDWIVTEFVRVTNTIYPPRVFHRICPELAQGCQTVGTTPVHLQLLGSDPAMMTANAVQAARLGARSIDINFGCPAKLVNRHDGGASLLRRPEHMERLIDDMQRALRPFEIPVTAKIRLGFDNKQLALACALATERGGASRLTVHARTKAEGYRRPAHWEWVRRIRDRISIPVVVNGDIQTLEDYWRATTLSGCQDAMIGRGLLADPALARRIKHWQHTGTRLPPTTWAEKAGVLLNYASRVDGALPDKVTLSLLKQWLNMMRLGSHDGEQWFQALKRERTLDEFTARLADSA
ncbi:tRNA dihydrouridine synthase [Larsenimonas rhizosphaerae]|uniref:tRNA-dihydrouridine(16) synthase n=1 Tax=Larsenimonas rhizosphaerae TaxID=2944682 RepID=A0AA41ZDS9_9GAMM|nr:tRNA-dihydrouridine synthase family protein [Larsenimonas rhizosphaerae]MCX2522691.1 tRNA-dihydrouridine synthase family protein [Larsenimonas rhizosphaerae]